MNGVHDMGGMHGLGPIEVEPDEPWFHHEWERRAFAITLAAGALGEWNIDMSRHARERMPGADYLASTYYEKWLWGLSRLLVERGLVPEAELAGRLRDPSAPVRRTGHPKVLAGPAVALALSKGSSTRVDADIPARFAPGDVVRARNIHPTGHTRLPRYARGKVGSIERDHGVHVFADANAAGLGPQPQHLYGVRFRAQELWGAAARGRDTVYIDLWEAHLEPL